MGGILEPGMGGNASDTPHDWDSHDILEGHEVGGWAFGEEQGLAGIVRLTYRL